MIVIIHGGGWTANDEDIMRGLARELTKGGKFVVSSMDYRWAGKADGDATPNTMADLIDDVFGGIAHIMEHAAQYGGDPTRIGVTGDSAGGHLSAAASLMTNMIGSRGFGKTPGVFEFLPSYLPKGKTAEQVRDDMTKAIKAAAPSYGVFSAALLNTYSDDPAADQSWKEAIAPLSHIPAGDRAVGSAVSDARHERSADHRRGGEGIRRRARQGRPARGVRPGRRRQPRVLRLEARRYDQGDIREVRRVLRRGDEGLLPLDALLKPSRT